MITLAGAMGGALMAVAVVLAMAQNGLLPINDAADAAPIC